METDESRATPQNLIAAPPFFGSHKLDLANEAFLKRGFSYLREENGFHHWSENLSESNDANVLLWERDGIVWIRASTPNTVLPTEDTPITEVWDDTGILPPIPESGLPVSEKVLSVREGKLSPLAIKRHSPVLQKIEGTKKVYDPLENGNAQIQRVFDTDARVIGLTAETGAINNYQVESHLLKRGTVNFNGDPSVVEEAVQYLQRQNLPSLLYWKNYRFQWDQVKEIPVDVRMATPFQHSNVCEDADRCHTLVEKGGDPSESICLKCPVYTVCQERGYLSQPITLQRAKTQIFGFSQALLDPDYSEIIEKVLEPIDDTERLCVITEASPEDLFLARSISKNTLEAWRTNWQGSALGNFAQSLLNVLDISSEPDKLVVKRIRMVMQAFQYYGTAIVRQMCQVNVRGKVVERKVVDDETKEALSHFTIVFEGGVSAYVPLDSHAATRLATKGFPIFRVESFALDKNMKIPMSIEQAIRFGILDAETVEKIQEFPRVYRNPNWTFWHQLKRFLTHYPRDTDAPMIWHNDVLEFWVPPVLHPSVKKLVLMSATLSERDFQRAFPDEKIETLRIKPTPWVAGNQVFQIRTGVHTPRTMLDYDSTWDVFGLSKTGERFLLGICAEIERDPSVKHAIITYAPVIKQLREVAKKENVCLLRIFKNLNNLDAAFQASDVIWIVGTPFWQPGVMWRRGQILFGNDEKPLYYETETEFQRYKDERIQHTYIQAAIKVITEIIGRAGLNRWRNKKVVLMSSLEIPNITDRPETLLFDWEDFQVAGSLDNLAETIAIRQQFETERANLTADSPRAEVERVLGCSSRQANRMLKKLRGGNRVTFREQILTLLADGEKKAADVVAAIDGNPSAIYHELRKLDEIGEIHKVGWGIYALPETITSKQ